MIIFPVLYTIFGELFAPEDLIQTNQAGCPFYFLSYILTFLVVAIVVVWIVTFIFLRNVRDAYKIKQEMLLYLITAILGSAFSDLSIVDLSASSAIFQLAVLFVNFGFYGYMLTQNSDDSTVSPDMDFDSCMQSQRFRARFADFLALQLCIENIRFWEDVQKFKVCAPDDLIRLAQEIFHKYIKKESPYEVNISTTSQQYVCKQLEDVENLTPDLFERAENEVLSMLKFHSFPLFMQKYRGSPVEGGSPSHASAEVSLSVM